tara:strand:+ start:144 stop:980 length:837 start_codon:yes stop_codon:yes gene_type:complete
MDTVIGLGKAGCAIADKFAEYPQYNILKIDSEGLNPKNKNCHLLKKQVSPEDYEKTIRSMKTFFNKTTDDILFVLSGSGMISGASLQILKNLKDKNVNILYIKPDLEFLGHRNIMQERVVRNVLQEYTRSGLFNRIFLVDNKRVEQILGEVPIIGYYDKLNDLIVSTFHMVNVYNHQEAIHATPFDTAETTRISTLGILNVDEGKEKLFFSLDNIREKCYYYAINSKVLETDGKLLRTLTDNINKNIGKEVRAGFQVYSTSYEQNYGYLVVNTEKTNN